MSERFLTVAKPATVGRYYFLKHKLFEEKIQRKSFVTFQNLQREPCKLKAIEKYFQSRKELASLKFTLKQKNHKDVKMLQTNLNVIAVGEPNLDVLSDGEKRSFFETLFSRIVEIHNEKQAETFAIQKI